MSDENVVVSPTADGKAADNKESKPAPKAAPKAKDDTAGPDDENFGNQGQAEVEDGKDQGEVNAPNQTINGEDANEVLDRQNTTGVTGVAK